jgi:hypothetical protein
MRLIPNAGLRQRLMILGGVLLPMLVLGVWLQAHNFFSSP